MKKFVLLLSLFILFFLSAIPTGRFVIADDFSELTKQIQQLEQQLAETRTREKTLTSQVAYMNNQIKLTTLKIDETQRKVNQLIKEIDSLSQKIDRLEESLDQLSKVLLARIVETYKRGNASTFQLLFSSGGFSEFLTRLKYIRIVQTHDKKLLLEMQLTKSDYSDQKQVREAKKLEQENLRRQLVDQTNQLARQKKEKETLLEVTRNDEKKYQQLLEEARAELAVVLGQGKETFLRDVSEGETVGKIISTASGCSSGPHLHFEVHKNNIVQDPNNFLRPISFSYSYSQDQYGYYGTINPHNSWNWPMNEPIEINQGFGPTGYAKSFGYPGGVHNGIDMYSKSSPTVKAVKQGKLYGGSYQCSGRYPGALLYAKVEQADGIITWYLHMVPQ